MSALRLRFYGSSRARQLSVSIGGMMRLPRDADAGPEERSVVTSELLKQLRIDRSDSEIPHSRARRFVLVGSVLVVLAGSLCWFALTRPGPPTVRTAVARAASQKPGANPVLDASGYVTARRQATVSAKITGKVAEALIEEGMRVQGGDVLARLNDTEAKAQLALAKAQLTAARSQVAEPHVQFVQAEWDYGRQQGLADRQLISAQALKAARMQRDMLRARLASTEGQIRVAQESVGVAQVQLDNAVVRAPSQARAISAAIDALFTNSPDETKTQPEKGFATGFAKQVGDIGALVLRILAAVFFTILLLTDNTMAQSIRECVPELAILKAIGFSDGKMTVLVLAAAVVLLLLGSALGMLAATSLMPALNSATGGRFPPLFVHGRTWLVAMGIAVALTLAIGLPPALRARRLQIIEALAGH
jgi:hypothetical protein